MIKRWDQVFEVLGAEPRRQLIIALNDTPSESRVHLPEAAISPVVSVDRKEFTLQLKHHHLPLLEEHGYIQWTVTPFRAGRGPHFDDVAIVFDALQGLASEIPDRLVHGCRRLESEREQEDD